MSHFAFLQPEWPDLFEAATKAEACARPDPRTACFYARRSLEMAVEWAYANDQMLSRPYRDDLSAHLHEPTFRALIGQTLFTKARIVKDLGNHAVHSQRPVHVDDAIAAVRELFHICFWLVRTYARGEKPAGGLTFDSTRLPTTAPTPPQSLAQLQQLEAQLHERDERLQAALSERAERDEELARLRAEVAAAKQANATRPDNHDYSERLTRDYFIDLLLKEAGWALDQPHDREYEVTGMPNNQGIGFVDYVLWGDDGKPLAVVEAKSTRHGPRVGQQQAKLYADCLENQFGQRPVIFYSNGYEHWVWDDQAYPPRPVAGFYTKAELDLVIQRRSTVKPLAEASINEAIAGRYYQARAIRRIAEAFEVDRDRKALLVMATGAGKTRTVIGLVDLLIRCNWVKRVLFLADRQALVKQGANNFKKYLPDVATINLLTEKDKDGRVYASTYPTIMNLIDDMRGVQRRFSPGHFDLIIIDEAHRSVFQKYRAIFDYFDALLVGLTATPKDEVDRNTYGLFDLETGVPTDAYGLDDAVRDHFLVPPMSVSVPLRFQREGIKYDDLSEDDKDRWDALEWDEEEGVPDRVEAEAINKWLFNKDTVDKVLEHLMTRGVKVAGGDRLGKTIIFAKNNAHAEYIAERFNANYAHYKGAFARVITHKTEYAESLIDDFSNKEKAPHIAVSVDMLDTGIDIPEVVNLVFFKVVRSKTKFYQMLGRGTRLCEDLFGPEQHKQFFYIFDFCQNLEFFSQDPATTDGALAASLGKRLFKARVELIQELDAEVTRKPAPAEMSAGSHGAAGSSESAAATFQSGLRRDLAELLYSEVGAMNIDNFVVRPRRKLVETYAQPEAWETLTPDAVSDLVHQVAGLPSGIASEPEEAKRFDLLLLKLQLALMRTEPTFMRLRDQVKAIAGLLEEKTSIPMVNEQLTLIQDLQTDEWWQDVTVSMLESARKRLRALVRLIEKRQRKPIFTDFEDQLGEETAVDLPGFAPADRFERFRAKARTFLKAHEDHIAIHKLRMNKPLTPTDLAELERILMESGVGEQEDLARATSEAQGLGLFVRSLVGLDREAAKEALGGFLVGTAASANQIEFMNLVVDYLTEHGTMPPALLYESPFTDLSPHGPDGLFPTTQVDRLLEALNQITAAAVAS